MGFNNYQRKEDEEREENDFYATHPDAIGDLFTMLEKHGCSIPLTAKIWENSCGQGHLVNPLRERGYSVLATDLIDRGCADSIPGVDFLGDTEWLAPADSIDAIIMNPPFKHLLAFIEKSLDIAPLVCAFLPLRVMETEERFKLFTNLKTSPRWTFVFSNRVPCSKNGLFPENESSTVPFCWMVWKRGAQFIKEWDIIPPRKYKKQNARYY